jgi:hypothetical protein
MGMKNISNTQLHSEKLLITTAAEANAVHLRICSLLIEDCFAIGEFLIAQKAKVKHGEWQKWVKENLIFCDRTARRYMWVAEHRHALESDTIGVLGGNTVAESKEIVIMLTAGEDGNSLRRQRDEGSA